MRNKKSLLGIISMLTYISILKILSGLIYSILFSNFRTSLVDIIYFQYSNLLVVSLLWILYYRFETYKYKKFFRIVISYLIGMIIGTIVFFIRLIFILNVSSFMIYNSNLNKEIALILLLLAVGFIFRV